MPARTPIWAFAVAILVLVVMGLTVPIKLVSQTSGEANDARLEQLYREAKAAEAAGNLGEAEARYKSMLQLAPRMAAAYNNLGSVYIQQREYQKAVEALEKGLKIDPTMHSASALLGIAKYEMGDYGAAQPHLEKALRANSKDNNAEMFLAKALIQLSKLEAAAVHLQQLSQRQPENQEVWYLLGKLYMRMSERALVKLNAIDPESVYVHEVSGEIMESMNNFDGALIEYKKAVEIAPQKPETHARLGNAYWTLKMWDPATQEFQAELVNDPRNCEAHWKLGNIRIEQHQEPESALEEIDKALTICPNLAQARLDRARVYLKLNRNEEAVQDLLAAVSADPSEPSIHFLLAQAYRGQGRSKDAQAEMLIFSKLEESNRAKTAERAQQLLEDKSNATPPQP